MDLQKFCKECRESFLITDGEQQFFIDRGMQIPARCKQCRQARRSPQGPTVEYRRPQSKANVPTGNTAPPSPIAEDHSTPVTDGILVLDDEPKRKPKRRRRREMDEENAWDD